MTIAPRVVLVHRATELEELVARHGTLGQVGFFLSTRGRDLAEVQGRHEALKASISQVRAAIPLDWRQGSVERGDLDRFLFAPEDIVVVVGQDGLVANVAKYLDGQPVIGIDPEPGRNAGVLVRHPSSAAADLIRSTGACRERTMVEAVADDGQSLVALNEVYVGQATHQTSRYRLTVAGRMEVQASSGLIVATGTGATGWARSAWVERHSTLALPAPEAPELCWFVREAWPSPTTRTTQTEGMLAGADQTRDCLTIEVESDRLVAFGDGIESDTLALSWGQRVVVRRARQTLRLVSG
ncbi:hypothetical protein FB381_3662 [Nocardioides albertanoniae]|uniref:NAD kinase n=1 Tax=Nocardioides albertanoniae TaxID=1175486 RepID=A0A543AAW9_9ACTN|nr:hypothetical protein [Nocardioides albertanoniae]TQL69748.1 hypothetical protein FB381_3662 [Nocardioides albertanoniae]